MTMCYTNKKMIWIKVAFILIEYGGEERELSKSTIIDKLSTIFPKQSLCSNALTPRIRPKVFDGVFQFVSYTSKIKGVKLIDQTVEIEHKSVMDKWRTKIN